jgi:hypothetical protein
MPELMNAQSSIDQLTEYDRSYGGSFSNPFNGVPQLSFFLQRVTVRDRDQKLLSETRTGEVTERYAPGRIYELRDPRTGSKVQGQTFSADQLYAMLYSVMCHAVENRPVDVA